jgi:hypothetical protein
MILQKILTSVVFVPTVLRENPDTSIVRHTFVLCMHDSEYQLKSSFLNVKCRVEASNLS